MAINNSSNSNGGNVGMGTGILLMFGMVGIMFAAIWFVKHDAVTLILLKYAYILTYIPARLCIALGFYNAPPSILIHAIVSSAKTPSTVTIDQILSMVNSASYTLLPFIGIMLFFAWKVQKHILRNMETLHDYWHLMKIQSLTNPCIVPVVRFTEYWLAKSLDRFNNLSRALTPDEFAIKHGLLKKNNNNQVVIDEKKFNIELSKQLGPVIGDTNQLSEYYRALAAIFMTRIIYRGEEGRNKAQKMLDAINISCDPNKTGNKQDGNCAIAFNFSEAASLFDELYKHEDIAYIKTFFIYEKTFLMALLNSSREDGKLSPSEFIWLKLIDRPLWYALYGVSEELIAKGYAEGAAAFGQYWASKTAMNNDQVLLEPYTVETIRGFEKRLFEANMVEIRERMTQKEIDREREFGRIPEI